MEYINEFTGLGGIRVRTVASSTHEGNRITTLETYAPKFIDAEFEKHRQLSSSSSSTRAIPFRILPEHYIPEDVRRAESGMQGHAMVNDNLLDGFKTDVQHVYEHTLSLLLGWGGVIHKQHLGRYLEPFAFQTKAVTSTKWDNFFRLRLANDVQPEMHELARLMYKAISAAETTELAVGEWHLPYALKSADMSLEDRKLSSAAGCARTSYGKAGGKPGRSLAKDLELADQLRLNKHLTPFEHQACPMIVKKSANGVTQLWENGVTHMDRSKALWSGNFKGWIQHRQLMEDWTDV